MSETLTPWIGSAPEDNGSIFILLGTENLVELERESVQVTDVEWAKVMVEVVVQKGVIDSEVVRLLVGRLGHGLGTMARSLRPLGRRSLRRFGIRKQGVLVGRMDVRGQVQTIFRVC